MGCPWLLFDSGSVLSPNLDRGVGVDQSSGSGVIRDLRLKFAVLSRCFDLMGFMRMAVKYIFYADKFNNR